MVRRYATSMGASLLQEIVSYDRITTEGFRIGGVDGHISSNGAAYVPSLQVMVSY
jgi:hypothetical protein